MDTSMYDTLLQLPLFQGLCKDDFTSIIEKVKFHFHHIEAGKQIFAQGEACKQLAFLLEGEICTLTQSDTHNYLLTEIHQEPAVIEPYSLFGMQTVYTATYKAHTKVKLLTIDKAFVLSDLSNFEIFRINFLNLLSNRCQTTSLKLRNSRTGNIKEKLADFFVLRCAKPQGEKTLRITMEDLAGLINETRINVSRLLNELQEKGVILLRRKGIAVPALEKLLEELGS